MGKAPKPPDPKETAAASTGTNVGTAIANAMLGNVNQVTPDGTLTYSQSGSHAWTDPYTGKNYTIPTFTATQTLSPEQQAIKDQTTGAQQNLAGIANDQSAFLKDYLGEGIDLSGLPDLASSYAGADDFAANRDEVEAALWERGASDRAGADEALRTRLLNSGIREGSAAWNAEMERMGRQKTDARLATMLAAGQEQSRLVGLARDAAGFQNAARGQGFQEAFAERAQPINEITALLSGSQVSQPNFVNASMPTIPTTDTAGIINSNYAQRMGQWQANQGLMGGLMGGIGSLISLSDDRAKKDKRKIGHLKELDLGVHEYRYKGEPESAPKRIGLMASEVEKKNPQAVKRRNGLRYVDYGRALGA